MYSFTYSEMTCKYSRCEGKCASLYMQVSYRSVSLRLEVISQQHCLFCSMKDTVAWVLLLLQLHLSLTFEAIYTHVHKDGLLLTPLMIIANIYSSWCKSHTLATVVSPAFMMLSFNRLYILYVHHCTSCLSLTCSSTQSRLHVSRYLWAW